MRDRPSAVYILASHTRTLYTGVTTDLPRRIADHKAKTILGFAAQYNCVKLVYFEEYGDIRAAISREKQLKGWRRSKKLRLVSAANPKWLDLAESWFDRPPQPIRPTTVERCGSKNSPEAPTTSSRADSTKNPRGISM